MSICRICNHEGSSHYPECPFSNIQPKRISDVPPIRVDYWLGTEDSRKRIKRDCEQGKYRYLGNGIFEEVLKR